MSRIESFSYMYGPRLHRGPHTLVIDARSIHKNFPLTKSGLDSDVQREVTGTQRGQHMLKRAQQHIEASPENSVLFGCNFGRHRSVALAEKLGQMTGITPHHTSPFMRGERHGTPIQH